MMEKKQIKYDVEICIPLGLLLGNTKKKKSTDNKIEIITKTGCSCVSLLLLRRLNTKSEQVWIKRRQYGS
jgi:hypothetical protein